MNRTRAADNAEAGSRTVLVLQADQALWFKWLGDVLLDSFVEPVRPDKMKQGVSCPWLVAEQESRHQLVELVLDTALDELDKVKTEVPDTGCVKYLRRWQLVRRMRCDYPHAAIHKLPGYMAPDILSIHHQLIPDTWCHWLQELQASNVIVSHVVTTTELLGRLHHSLDGAVLFNTESGVEYRHLLVDSAAPLFMRLVHGPSLDVVADERCATESDTNRANDRVATEIYKTLDYATGQLLPQGRRISVLTPLTQWKDCPSALNAACILAALCVNTRVDFTIQHWCEGQLSEPQQQGISVRLPEGGVYLLRLLRRLFDQVPWPLPPVKSTSMNPDFSVTGKRRRSTQALVSSVNNSLLRQRINALRSATVMSALMATLTVMLAGVHGIDSARKKAKLSVENGRLSDKIVHLANAVETLNPSPEFVFRSLQRIEAYQSVKPMEPQVLLSTVAGAITDFPALILDSLSWSVLGEGSTSDDDVSVNSGMMGREALWIPGAERSQIHIELSGAVSSQQGLRDQQSAVKSFVAYLESVQGISSVSVLESPAQAARSSQVMVETGARYRLSLVLSKS